VSDDASLRSVIRRAHDAGELELAVDFAAVNRSGVPGFRTTDIVVPPFVLVVLSAYLSFAVAPWVGAAAFVAGGALLFFILRPWNRRRAEERSKTLALATPEHWETLWRLGGLAMRATGDPAARCVAPDGDWRAFVKGHLAAGARDG